MHFLANLLDLLFPLGKDALLVRNASSDDILALVQPKSLRVADAPAVALLPYHDPLVAALVREAKYHRNEKAILILGDVLREHLTTLGDDAWGPWTLIPIPLAPLRLNERGYNQSEVIAMSGVEALALPGLSIMPKLLVRTRETASQAQLRRIERQTNMQGVFRAPFPLSDDTLYIVFDDVMTTGATMTDAVRALKEAGAKRIMVLALSS